MSHIYYCQYCNGQNVWVDVMRHLNEPNSFLEQDTFYCEDCNEELQSIGIREAEAKPRLTVRACGKTFDNLADAMLHATGDKQFADSFRKN